MYDKVIDYKWADTFHMVYVRVFIDMVMLGFRVVMVWSCGIDGIFLFTVFFL